LKPLGTLGGIGFLLDLVRRWRARPCIVAQLIDFELGPRAFVFRVTNKSGSERTALKNRVRMTAWSPGSGEEIARDRLRWWRKTAEFKIEGDDLVLDGLKSKDARAVPLDRNAVHPLLHFYTFVFYPRRGRRARVRTFTSFGDEVGAASFYWHLARARLLRILSRRTDFKTLTEYQAIRRQRRLDR
jgi:hypothetical protein